jgi:ABC-type antimicrobial peptide transport system permease subunit
MQDWRRETRHSVRGLIASPGFTIVAVLSLALAIGVNTTVLQRSQVVWLVLRQVVVLAGAGLALGVPAALAASRSVQSLLFGVTPADPWSLAAGAVGMLGVALAAGFAPARRAARLDPLVALRRE